MTVEIGWRVPCLAGVVFLTCGLAAVVAAQRPAPRAVAPPLDSADLASARGTEAFERGTKEGSEEAIRHFLSAAELYRRMRSRAQVADMLSNVAYLHNSLGRPDSALHYYARVLQSLTAASQRAALAETLTLMGEVFQGVGKIDSALAYYRPALTAARRVGERQIEGRTLSNIGAAYHATGHSDSALTYLRLALLIRREVGDSLGEGVTLNNLALVERTLGRPDSAIRYLRRSLALRRAVKDRAGEGTTLNNIAYAFEELDRNDSALAYYRRALPVLERVGKRSTVGVTLANLGRVYSALGQHDSALSYLHRGLAIKREVRDRIGEGWALYDLGRAHQASGEPDVAIAYLLRALAVLREAGDRAFEGDVLFYLGNVHHRRTRGRNLSAAVAYYDSAAAVRAAVGTSAGGDENRLSFAEQDVRLFEEWSLAWLARTPEVGADRATMASLAAAERGRAQALLELLRRSVIVAPAASAANQDRRRPGGSLWAEADSLVAPLRRGRSAALSYLVTPDTLLTWLLLPSGRVRVSATAMRRDTLAALVRAVRTGLSLERTRAASGRGSIRATLTALEAAGEPGRESGPAVSFADAQIALARLASLLLPTDLERQLPTAGDLVIVPHGPLALLPFSALPTSPSTEPLGIRYALRFAPSLAALSTAENRPDRTAGRDRRHAFAQAVIVGNPVMPARPGSSRGRGTLPALPGAGREARWVAHRLGVQPVTGPAATESAVTARLPAATLIHLATHGVAFSSDAKARDSFVALTPDSASDGLLTVGEVLDDPALRLTADLVVLSACQTGLGRLRAAEGTVGLQRAFLARGARSVLVSLWSVSDRATELLMRGFYTHWLSDADAPSKAEALRRAQQDVRRTRGFEHARDWAAFQLVGAR